MTEPILRRPKLLTDYQAPRFAIRKTALIFELHPTATRVTSKLSFERLAAGNMLLDGQSLELHAIRVNGQELASDAYALTAEGLEISEIVDSGVLEIVTSINPEQNTALEGLYLANGVYCTQCEAEGFRRITYYPDRPDVLAEFTTTIIADTTQLPFLLSNGNKIAEECLPDGRTQVIWHDPFPKPAYLFALVAGNFDCLQDTYTTASGRPVLLEFYVEKGDMSRSKFAMAALKRAMHWDESRFGLAYDLDRYMVVAVDFFNMGAMENKGLNIFNSKYVLADDASATDQDYFNIESIIGHEYFHNWTGNRVTCRDWFQLSLKEGLTVFRDQEFSADMGSATLNRIDAVKLIRTAQFAEDASPMAHPIRPEKVLEMNNFYTVTVYDKGAEVIRMLQTILGKAGFNAGLACYLERHDGQAVTCDDFIQAMQDANQYDLAQFRRWYSQSGTPEITVSQQYDCTNMTLRLSVSQKTPATADQATKQTLVIPIGIEILTADSVEPKLIVLTEHQQDFYFTEVQADPLVVWLTDFSAPVKLHTSYTLPQLLTIALQAQNGFARWDAMQQYWHQFMAMVLTSTRPPEIPSDVLVLFKNWLQHPQPDLALTAELLSLPDFETLAAHYQPVPVDRLLNGLTTLQQQLATMLEAAFYDCYQRLPMSPYQYDEHGVAVRKLKAACLHYLALTARGVVFVERHYQLADNLTDQLAALKAAQQAKLAVLPTLLADFARRNQQNVQVMDKYFALVAQSTHAKVFDELDQLTKHALFSWKNPNRVRAVFGTFSLRNPTQFHREDGEGYRLLANIVSQIDKANPQLAARLITPLLSWQRYDEGRQAHMLMQLRRLVTELSLSNDVFEKVSRSLP